jgi:hypothetical protein
MASSIIGLWAERVGITVDKPLIGDTVCPQNSKLTGRNFSMRRGAFSTVSRNLDMKKSTFELLVLCLLLTSARSSLAGQPGAANGQWVRLFDGKTLEGWKAGENGKTFSVRNGMIVADGPRSHLFYVGPIEDHHFTNFEFKADVMTMPGANSGIYFHTESQERGQPIKGYEVQISNTYSERQGYRELSKTGGLRGVRDLFASCVEDKVWFTVHIIVQGRRVRVKIDGKPVVDYVEPDEAVRTEERAGTALSHGTFALQAFDRGGAIHFKNICVKPLPYTGRPRDSRSKQEIEFQKRITSYHAADMPLIDYHVHLKGGLTLEEALQKSREVGITYGIAENCGLGFNVTGDEGLKQSLERLRGWPAFKAMQAEGREWVGMFSPELIARFDYVFTDAMTFTDKQGRRTRLWMKNEVHIDDKQDFMDMYVDKIVTVLDNEPIDIYVNPTFLPAVIAEEYDRLWTRERMDKVVQAAVKNDVAIEINARYRIPSARFIKLAKNAGAKFAFGTNNGGRELGHLEYCLEMIDECELTRNDMFVPKPYGEKPVQTKGLPRTR